jgi:DNA-binding NarL/FixJ family response regulator
LVKFRDQSNSSGNNRTIIANRETIREFSAAIGFSWVPTTFSSLDAPKLARVLLADDHPAMLALTAAALAGKFSVIASVADGRELLGEAERLHPDIIVLDITMPRLDGIRAAHQLSLLEPAPRLVFLTVHEDADYARAAIDAGGLGYVVKARLASDLIPAIHAALANRRFVSPTIFLDETS